METMKRSGKVKILLLSAAFLAAMIILGLQYYSRYSLAKMVEVQRGLINDMRISSEAGALQADIRAMESKVQAYLLTGDQQFLAGKELNRQEAEREAANLLHLAAAPEEKMLAAEIARLLPQKIRFTNELLAARQYAGADSATAMVKTGQGNRLIEAMEKCITSLQQSDIVSVDQMMTENLRIESNVRWLDISGIVLIILITFVSVLIAMRDIDRTQRLNRELKEARAKAEQSAVLKEQFMANMSHEIRTPMNAIIGFAGRLSATPLSVSQQEYAQSIRESGENLLRIVNDILDFSRLDAGMVRFEEIPFSVSALLHSVKNMFVHKAAEKKLELSFSDELKDTMVAGDPTRLSQILVNLVGNALKFTSRGSISVKAAAESADEQQVLIRFTVSDTGIGIPRDKLERIFERFEQAANDTARKFGGTGLGLSIVKGLIEQQDGSITVSSEEGKGSVFSFVIPYRRVKSEMVREEPAAASAAHEPFPENFRVLVVEDNLLNQRLISLLLSDWKIGFAVAASAQEAFGLLRSSRFDLVLMDIQLPGMNGYDAAKTIREELGLGIPIIASTAHVLPGEKEKCLRNGMNGYLAKPFREQELFSLLSEYASAGNRNAQAETTVPPQKSGIINLDYLREISGDNPAFIREMEILFLEEVPGQLDLLDALSGNSQFDQLYPVAHKLKSTVVFMGLADLLYPHLDEIERLSAERSNDNECRQHIREVRAICERAIAELKAMDHLG